MQAVAPFVVMILVFASDGPVPGNPLVPTFQIASESALRKGLEVDLLLTDSAEALERVLSAIPELRKTVPVSRRLGNLAFQITRGTTGISL